MLFPSWIIVLDNRAIRSYLGVHRYASNVAINGDVDWTTPHTRRKICMTKLWNRLVKMLDIRPTKKIFCGILIAIGQTHGVETWNIFFTNLDMIIIYENGHLCNGNKLKDAIEWLKNIDTDTWKRHLVTQPKLRTYRMYKHDLCTEEYVKNEPYKDYKIIHNTI